jgi:NAD(P)-dependent dehydrogenase (short-subunit alcohol dehydrogenase family)
MDYFNVKDKVVIVTGGSSGLGYGFAQVFARAGSRVVLVNRSERKGQEAAEAIRAAGGDAVSIPADVSIRKSVGAMIERVIERHGRIDVLINNAGIIIRRMATEMTEEEWDRQIDTNLKGTFNCCAETATHMIRQRSGKIINLASIAATRAVIQTPAAYAATKAGLVQMSRVMAIEWIPYNINVNVIAPGFFETPMSADLRAQHPEEFVKIQQQIPQGRTGRIIEELGGVAIFLASDACQYMVGQVIYVDGGSSVGDGRAQGRLAGAV